jgi:hypothetical protein
MARMLNGIEHGLAPDVDQVADLVKKISFQKVTNRKLTFSL